MGYLKVTKEPYSNPQDVINVIYYITDLVKCGYRPLCSTNNIICKNPLVSPDIIASQFLAIQNVYQNPYKRRIYHIIYSLDNALDDTRLPAIFSIGLAFTWRYPNYQSIFTVHQDKEHPHLHMVINNIPLTGTKTLSSYINYLDLETIASYIQDEYWQYSLVHIIDRPNPHMLAYRGFDRYKRR